MCRAVCAWAYGFGGCDHLALTGAACPGAGAPPGPSAAPGRGRGGGGADAGGVSAHEHIPVLLRLDDVDVTGLEDVHERVQHGARRLGPAPAPVDPTAGLGPQPEAVQGQNRQGDDEDDCCRVHAADHRPRAARPALPPSEPAEKTRETGGNGMRIDASGYRLPPPRVRASAADDPAAQKGGRRISFTLRPAPLPSRNVAMTPFLMNAGAAAHPKSMRRPPFSTPPTPRTATSGASQRGSSPSGPDGVVLLEPGDGARDHLARTRWRARAATAGAVDRASRGNRRHAKGFTRGASCRGGTSAEIAG